NLLNLSQSLNISASDPVKLAGVWNQTVEETIILAFQNRPELPKFIAQRNISVQRRRQALSQLGPQISLVANYSLLDQFNDNISVTDGYSLGVQASLNLFDGGAARARAAQEKTNITIAEGNFAKQRDQIRFDVEQQYTQLQSNLTNIQTTDLALQQAKEALRLARLRFQAGVGTQTDVIAAENDLTRAESDRVTAILNYNRAFAFLQRAVTARVR
ncbi:TolC family protein, partial [Dulcicalothrix desertica]